MDYFRDLRFIADDHGNVMIEPVGGKTVSAGRNGVEPVLKAIGTINENNNAILEMMLQHGLDLDKMEGDMTLKK